MKYKTYLLFGVPGCGKGTQGQILGKIPGYFHVAMGDVFRSLDKTSELGKVFVSYSSKGQLVPDDVTVKLWHKFMEDKVAAKRFKPETDILILDGIPRNENQAKIMDEYLNVIKVFHLSSSDRNKILQRLKNRALLENRLDDADEKVILKRFETYENESKPVLNHYDKNKILQIEAIGTPLEVLRNILEKL